MARETDFLDLYRTLDLEPGCNLDEFKRAYRRRVSVLHPDRGDNNSGEIIAAQRLQQLTAMYGMAMEFQRQHGRLPGAPQARPGAQTLSTGSAPSARQPAVASRRRRLPWWLFLPGIATVVWLLWPGEFPPATSPSTTSPAQPVVMQAQPAAETTTVSLSLGMDTDAVRASEGEPTLMINNDRWEYGPSWIRFERGKVVDWYSSPLYPLRTATRSPSHGTD